MAKTRAPATPSSDPRYYRAADRVGPELWAWLPLVGGGGAVLLGFAYAFLAYLSSVLELSGWLVVVTPFFAVGLVALARWVCRLGKVRRPRLGRLIAFGLGAAGLYASWHVYLNFAAEHRDLFTRPPTWRMSPSRLWLAMRELAADRGWTSWPAWLLEAGTVFGFIAYLTGEAAEPAVPYCEQCGRWTDEAFRLDLRGGAHSGPVEELTHGRTAGLRGLGPRKPGDGCVRVRALRCPCGASRFACVDAVSMRAGTKGGLRHSAIVGGRPRFRYDLKTGPTEEAKAIVTNLQIDDAAWRELEDIRAELAKA